MKFRLLKGVALCALLAMTSPALAQDTAAEEDPVVATVNGTDILHSEVMQLASSLPPQYQAQAQLLMPMLLERMIDIKLINMAANEAGLSEDEEVLRRLEDSRQEIMSEVYLERLINEQTTDERVKAKYEVFLEENPPVEETHARHILLEDEAAARDAIKRLDEGADFADLARELSTGPSSEQGGDLGYFTKEQMVPEFAEAAFTMEPGSHSADPVQTQFGWHVIKVEDRRSQPSPTLEELQGQMENEVARDVVAERVKGLRDEATIEVVGAAEAEQEGEDAADEEPAQAQ